MTVDTDDRFRQDPEWSHIIDAATQCLVDTNSYRDVLKGFTKPFSFKETLMFMS